MKKSELKKLISECIEEVKYDESKLYFVGTNKAHKRALDAIYENGIKIKGSDYNHGVLTIFLLKPDKEIRKKIIEIITSVTQMSYTSN